MIANESYKWLSLLLVISLTGTVSSLKILGMFAHPAISHFKFFHPIMRGLAEVGHSVDVVSPFPDKAPPTGYTDYKLPSSNLSDMIPMTEFERPLPFLFHYAEFYMLYAAGKDACNITLHSQALAKILKHPPGYYDVILMEHFNTDCLMSVAHVLQAPVIGMSSCALMPWHYERMGAPLIPSYISALFMGKSQQMSFAGRLGNWITVHSINLLYKMFSYSAADALVRQKFGPGLPSTREMVRNTSLMLLNQHFSLSGPKPLPPNIIEVGGVHLQPAKPLPAELQQLLDKATKGVILISWGSQLRASSLSEPKRNAMVRAIARLEQQVIWKWENETLPNKPDNLHIMKWLPQRDLFAHPNVKLFLSHGGLMGTSEAVSSGVPMVGMPMYGDQSLNIESLVERGMALRLDFHKLSEQTIYETITRALDPSFKVNALAVASAYNNRVQQPLETAIWWVEHVAETKGAPLVQPSAVHLSRFVYYSLDVYLLVISVLLLLFIACLGLRRICPGGKRQAVTKLKRK
ncbi:UDP-glucuronosyltransferase 2B17 [Drosophila subobscura]|uniref:UDP-glucuronosyltransferase 2B17 n=1 Tax=Drosophila subobscura TaxID=7241 RepID=UPI00155ABB1F|nr:UDP-glucuronosyltransferase 2B17 [Drosophila subobscura]